MPQDPSAQMSPEEMQAMQQQSGKDNSQNATQLVQQVGQGLSQLADMINKMPSTGPEARQAIMKAMQAYSDAVDILQGKEAEQAGPMPADQGAVPMEGGAQGQPMGPQGRQ